jgi:hypothetical protein
MGRQAKTQNIIDQAREILEAFNPMTLRQVYYQLVSRQVIDNNRSTYQAVSNALVDARREGIIPWEWMEDRTRRPSIWAMYDDPADFASIMKYRYKRDVWRTQPARLEVWLEKDALSGLFKDVVGEYGVTLCVGRGYDGWDSIHNAAERYGAGDDVTVLYFGDFDPSGEDMVRSLRDRLADLGSQPTIVKKALTMEDIRRYNLPPNFTKATDTRSAGHIAKYGDVSVELDALPPTVLQARLRDEVENHLDMEAFKACQEQERKDRELIVKKLDEIS